MKLLLKTFLSCLLCFTYWIAIAQSPYTAYQEAYKLKKEGKVLRATRAFDNALALAKKKKNIKLQMKCHQQLAELTDNVVQYKKAIAHYKEFSRLYNLQQAQEKKKLQASNKQLTGTVQQNAKQIDSLETDVKVLDQEVENLTQAKMEAELRSKDLEIENQKRALELNEQKLALSEEKNQKNILYGILALIGLLSFFAIIGFLQKRRANKMLAQKNEVIASEKQKSEDLLLNILPVPVANELKETGHTTVDSFAEATVMFTDFKGFTGFAERQSAEEVVSILDFCFKAFDAIIASKSIEKIKTIGDAYLCVSGVPNRNPNHANDILEAAVEFQRFITDTARKYAEDGKEFFQMRIGIHSGPLVAGVVGSKKFAYDIWGDTVNIAARMEQAGAAGRVNVSETVYENLKSDYIFEYRGEVEAKNKGEMKMYFLAEG